MTENSSTQAEAEARPDTSQAPGAAVASGAGTQSPARGYRKIRRGYEADGA